MSISVPTTYDTTDLTFGEGLVSGAPVVSSGLEVIVDNHNFVGYNYRPSVANFLLVTSNADTGYTAPSATDWRTLTGAPVLAEANGRGLTFTGVFTNTSTHDHSLRLACGSNTGSAVTLSASSNAVLLTMTCDTPAGSNFVAGIQALESVSSGDSKIFLESGVLYWSGATGSQLEGPQSNSFVPALAGEVAATEPLTVEFVNRMLNGPYHTWAKTPQSLGTFSGDWDLRKKSTSSTTFEEIGQLLIIKRRPSVSIKFAALGSGGVLRVEYNGTNYDVTLSGAEPADDVTLSSLTVHTSDSIDLAEVPEMLVARIYLRKTGTDDAVLGCLNVVTDK